MFVALVCIGADTNFLSRENYFIESAGYTLIAVTFAALIGTVIARPAWTRLAFENGFMRFFGKYSYGLYVFHYSIDNALTPILRRWLDAVFHSKAVGVVVSALIVGALAVMVAYASYHLYEKHFLKLKRYFEPNGVNPHKQGVVTAV
jgi:peptidoglycan/LPS O-acetylase OafA/YrhL